MCVSPLTGWWSSDLTVNGKRTIVFNPKKALDLDQKIQVPCGHCIQCRLDHAKMWALRCWHESLKYPFSSFVTLTYDDDHLKSPSLIKEDFVLFMKRLRKKYGNGIKYFHCGEYGSLNFRPHHHIILFGFIFPDQTFNLFSSSGHMRYNSDSLNRLWSFGLTDIGLFEPACAAYVARYTDKKQELSTQWFLDRDLVPPYLSMSKGIGLDTFNQNSGIYLNQRFCVDSQGHKLALPRYYKSKFTDEQQKYIQDCTIRDLLDARYRGDFDIDFEFRNPFEPHRRFLRLDRADVLKKVIEDKTNSMSRNNL